MRWPWQRRDDETAPPGGASTGGDAPAAQPSPMGWAFLPPLQREVGEMPLVSRPESFPAQLPAWRNPSFTGALAHRVSADAPSGVIDGDGGGTAEPSVRSANPDLVLLAPAPIRPVPQVQRSTGPAASVDSAGGPPTTPSLTSAPTTGLPVLAVEAYDGGPDEPPAGETDTFTAADAGKDADAGRDAGGDATPSSGTTALATVQRSTPSPGLDARAVAPTTQLPLLGRSSTVTAPRDEAVDPSAASGAAVGVPSVVQRSTAEPAAADATGAVGGPGAAEGTGATEGSGATEGTGATGGRPTIGGRRLGLGAPLPAMPKSSPSPPAVQRSAQGPLPLVQASADLGFTEVAIPVRPADGPGDAPGDGRGDGPGDAPGDGRGDGPGDAGTAPDAPVDRSQEADAPPLGGGHELSSGNGGPQSPTLPDSPGSGLTLGGDPASDSPAGHGASAGVLPGAGVSGMPLAASVQRSTGEGPGPVDRHDESGPGHASDRPGPPGLEGESSGGSGDGAEAPLLRGSAVEVPAGAAAGPARPSDGPRPVDGLAGLQRAVAGTALPLVDAQRMTGGAAEAAAADTAPGLGSRPGTGGTVLERPVLQRSPGDGPGVASGTASTVGTDRAALPSPAAAGAASPAVQRTLAAGSAARTAVVLRDQQLGPLRETRSTDPSTPGTSGTPSVATLLTLPTVTRPTLADHRPLGTLTADDEHPLQRSPDNVVAQPHGSSPSSATARAVQTPTDAPGVQTGWRSAHIPSLPRSAHIPLTTRSAHIPAAPTSAAIPAVPALAEELQAEEALRPGVAMPLAAVGPTAGPVEPGEDEPSAPSADVTAATSETVAQTPATATAAGQTPGPGGAPGAAAGAGAGATSPEQLEALAQRLFVPLVRRIKAEMLLDRERRGLRTDAW